MPEQPIPNMPQTPSRRKLEADWANTAEELTNEKKEVNLEAFIGEYLRNTNRLRDCMINKVKHDDSYSEWCGEQAGHIAARQNHTDAAVGSRPVFLTGQAGPAVHRPGWAALSGGFSMSAGHAGVPGRVCRLFLGGREANLQASSWWPGDQSAGFLLAAGRPIWRLFLGGQPAGFICQRISSIEQA